MLLALAPCIFLFKVLEGNGSRSSNMNRLLCPYVLPSFSWRILDPGLMAAFCSNDLVSSCTMSRGVPQLRYAVAGESRVCGPTMWSNPCQYITDQEF